MTDDDGAPKRKRRTGGRGARPTLNRDVIVATALAIIDADGLESLSMRKLGAQLGVDPMAVYYHLPNKAALFDGVVEAILSELGQDLISLAETWKPDDEWSSEVVAVMSTYREVLRRHPYALPVVSTRPVRSPEALASFERILDAYTRAGFDLQSAVFAMTCAVEFTIGHVLAEAGEPFGGETPYTPDAFAEHQGDLPNSAAAWEASSAPDTDALYTLGLRSMLDGLRARMGTADRST